MIWSEKESDDTANHDEAELTLVYSNGAWRMRNLEHAAVPASKLQELVKEMEKYGDGGVDIFAAKLKELIDQYE